MESYNLITEPWIKVLDGKTNSEHMVSIKELLQNASDYRQLAGEMHAQDLAVLRLLEAILTTVYTRVDQNDEEYEWVTLDEQMHVQSYDDEIEGSTLLQVLTKTWNALYKEGSFSEAVFDYLDKNKGLFDFFGDRPFYQVTAEQYDSFVPDNKKIAKGSGTVDLMQINRLISQSGNSVAIFSPKSANRKNKLTLDELVRWVITYQNFTGVTDKTKVKAKEKMSNSRGWLYTLNPVYAQGKNLFETLMLNLLLFNPNKPAYTQQRPVWEEDLGEYVKRRLSQVKPDNFAETYTVWSRLLHIEWQDGTPTIFSAGLPAFDSANAYDIEPMSTWRMNKKDENYYPATRQLSSIGIAMWRNFGQYVDIEGHTESREPLTVAWLNYLKTKNEFLNQQMINLHTSGIISNGGATSLMPAAEFDDNLRIEADVLFDETEDRKNAWPQRIEEMVDLNQEVGRKYYGFLMEVGRIRFGPQGAADFAGRKSQTFYDNLNEPFENWLANLSGGDDRDKQQELWKKQLRQIALRTLDDFLEIIAPRDISGIKADKSQSGTKSTESNIFIAANKYRAGINKALSKNEK
ncbi:CRISPR-associated protein [Lactobacillus delbrueckii subsp. bulgaricus]|nr:CRISPR-associated protein [Lactobacillus delbrueckii subsp. bulgaricus]MBT8819273.1 CRISPR-associated protein [Lactobacillus delbrueckii subsp. bulgaricus]MBT8822429.1 CRISPR-associated protein [Lactobacillus delbrueckii subsp. bulgaricus]MBT8831943.1 CRISPR-associated protein [Lactobacillus delbrueckii subsp. bulgaricus]MBT8869823.1 CRISPR-associated protein [Lactobacillus delbrueckii subsp. bulgaricus]